MIECLIIGDSIATGIAQHRPECQVQAQVGINSNKWLNKYPISPKAKSVLISLGSNDSFLLSKNNQYYYNILKTIRDKYKESNVTWVLPNNNGNEQSEKIIEIIMSVIPIGDNVLKIKNVYKDKIHPTGKEYKRLSENF